MKPLSLIVFLLLSIGASAQPVNATINQTSFPTTWNRNRGAFTADQYLQLPKRTFNVPFKNVDSLGQMQIDPMDSIPGYFNGRQWRKFVYQSQLNGLLLNYVPNSSYMWPVPGTPSVFPPAVHTHQISDITGLQSDLNDKLNKTDTTAKWYPRNSNPLFYINQSQGDIRYAKISDTIGGPGNGKIMTTAAAQNAIAGLQAGVNSKEPIIAPGTTAQYWRGDKTWQTLNKAAVGLTNVDNTSDLNKPISTATQTALNGKYNTPTGNTSQYVRGDGSLATLPANAPVDTRTAYGTGTAYNLTTTYAKIDFSTTDPTITLPSAGTYLIRCNVRINYTGLMTNLLTVKTVNFKVRRTNNTPADISAIQSGFDIPIIGTAFTGTAGDADPAEFQYTATTAGDVIELWGIISALVTTGNVTVVEASIIAQRIY